MSTVGPVAEQLEAQAEARAASGALPPAGKRVEWLYFAVRNRKLVIGFTVVTLCLVVALVGPWLVDADPFAFGYGTGLPPSSEHLPGTTAPGRWLCHYLRTFFLPATVFLGPLRVRALVWVRCPRTGSPLRWRMPW